MTDPLVAVVGCGNPNRSDDGAGSRVVSRLREHGLGSSEGEVLLLDAGTDGMAVMFGARGCTSLIVVDACRSGAVPGAIFEVPGGELAKEHSPSLNLHDFRWDHAIAAGQKLFGPAFPSDVTVLLIEARCVDFGLGLSPEVDAATSRVAERVEAMLRVRTAGHARRADALPMADRLEDEIRAALSAADVDAFTPADRAEMLMEMAVGLQQRPRSSEYIEGALTLYERARELCPAPEVALAARIDARRASALQALPGGGHESLERARAAYDGAMVVLREHGSPEELAELEMNLGLVIQALTSLGRARITDAIAAYQRALRTFDRARHPKEFAILQNNLATAFLSIPLVDERGKMREALAVQAFEEGLRVVNLIDHPVEYAMLQNNLGNALQYVSSSHALENNARAIEAYDEALKVRTRDKTPLEYANTVSNRANCLWNLPDDLAAPERGNPRNMGQARAHYAEARELFMAHGAHEQARVVAEALGEIERALLTMAAPDAPPKDPVDLQEEPS
jgi:hydrogenase maturation protease